MSNLPKCYTHRSHNNVLEGSRFEYNSGLFVYLNRQELLKRSGKVSMIRRVTLILSRVVDSCKVVDLHVARKQVGVG